MLIPICIPAGKCVSLPYERSPIRTYRAMGLLFACLFPPKTAGLHAQTAATTWHVGKTTCTCGRKRPACRKKKRGLRKNLPRPKRLNILFTSQKSIKDFFPATMPRLRKTHPSRDTPEPVARSLQDTTAHMAVADGYAQTNDTLCPSPTFQFFPMFAELERIDYFCVDKHIFTHDRESTCHKRRRPVERNALRNR